MAKNIAIFRHIFQSYFSQTEIYDEMFNILR
ncbi:MAG: hypothetical protein ACI96M_003564 [Candidatus Azotimanducaceae bacterium]|jgi:hypothetical protein